MRRALWRHGSPAQQTAVHTDELVRLARRQVELQEQQLDALARISAQLDHLQRVS